jgi:hypothetical protein
VFDICTYSRKLLLHFYREHACIVLNVIIIFHTFLLATVCEACNIFFHHTFCFIHFHPSAQKINSSYGRKIKNSTNFYNILALKILARTLYHIMTELCMHIFTYKWDSSTFILFRSTNFLFSLLFIFDLRIKIFMR